VALMATHLACASAASDEAKVEHLGLELIGNLEGAGSDLAAARAVVLIVHDALAFHGASGPRALQAALAGHRQPSLAITLGLGIDARRKPFDCTFEHDHRDSDAAQEIAVWVRWLVSQGAKAVVLAGVGRGALQVAMPTNAPGASADPAGGSTSAPTSDPVVQGLVLIAPAPSDPAARIADYRTRFAVDLGQILADAHRVASDAGEDTSVDVPGFLGCARSRVTAGAFLDAYDPDRAPDLVRLVRARGLPVLTFLADGDARRAAFDAAATPAPGGTTLRIEMLSTGAAASDLMGQPATADRIGAFVARLRP
jgi:hypothetical protein